MANYCHGVPRPRDTADSTAKTTRGKKTTEVLHPMSYFDHSLPEAHDRMDCELHKFLHSHYRLKTTMVVEELEEGDAKVCLRPWNENTGSTSDETLPSHIFTVEKLEETNFWYYWAGSRLLTLKCKANPQWLEENEGDGLPNSHVRRHLCVGQHTYEILGVKCSTASISKSSSRRIPNLTLTYIAVFGPGWQAIDLERELSRLGHFGSLAPHKAAARMELLLTPTARYVLKDVSNLQLMPPNEAAEYFGCGFIPPFLLEEMQCGDGPEITAIQVRIVAPRLGIFKGMLCAKPGITKIQLPASMQKVGPALHQREGDDWAVIVIVSGTGVHPNKANRKIDSFLKAGRGQEETSFARLSLAQRVNRSGMREITAPIARLLRGLGVPQQVFARYVDVDGGALQWKHASVVGVADFTGAIPRGHVFVSGLLGGTELETENGESPTVFVTRHPPVELKDGARMPMVVERPLEMSQSDWDFLSGLGFGLVFFSTQQEELVAEGDLDGDEYFVCWEPSILSSLPMSTVGEEHETAFEVGGDDGTRKETPLETRVEPSVDAEARWLQDAQHYMLDVERADKIHHLVSTLCTEAMKIVDEEDCSPENMSHSDVVALSKAYKLALNVGKHGGKVRLAPHLHSRIPTRLHEFLQ